MELNKAVILEALKQVYDPEIPVDIVNLGLVYDVHIDEGLPRECDPSCEEWLSLCSAKSESNVSMRSVVRGTASVPWWIASGRGV